MIEGGKKKKSKLFLNQSLNLSQTHKKNANPIYSGKSSHSNEGSSKLILRQ